MGFNLSNKSPFKLIIKYILDLQMSTSKDSIKNIQTMGEAFQHLNECPLGCEICEDWRNQYVVSSPNSVNKDNEDNEDVDSIERWG